MIRIILFLTLLFTTLNEASAQKLATLQLCMSARGVLTAKQKCARGETRLSQANLGSFGLVGPQGPQGGVGIPGTFDLSKCITRTNNATFSGYPSAFRVRVECAPDEFVLTHGNTLSTALADTIDLSLLFVPGGFYPQGVEYRTGANDGYSSPYTMSVAAVCCRP